MGGAGWVITMVIIIAIIIVAYGRGRREDKMGTELQTKYQKLAHEYARVREIEPEVIPSVTPTIHTAQGSGRRAEERRCQ